MIAMPPARPSIPQIQRPGSVTVRNTPKTTGAATARGRTSPRERLDQDHTRRPLLADPELDEVVREQRDADAERDPPHQVEAVRLLERLEQQVEPVLHPADSRVERLGEDAVDAVGVAGDRPGE